MASFEVLFLFQSNSWAKEQSLKLASIRSRTEDIFQVPSGLDAKPIAEPGAPSGFIFRVGVWKTGVREIAKNQHKRLGSVIFPTPQWNGKQ